MAQDGQPGAKPHVRVRLYDYVALQRGLLTESEQLAGRILEQAGVEVEWLPCRVPAVSPANPRCDDPIAGPDVIVSILPQKMAAKFHQPSNFLAFSAVDSNRDSNNRIWVFYDAIRALGQNHASNAQVLGHVEAHELGHILMRDPSHSAGGLMRAHWTNEDLLLAQGGELLFTRSQAERMQIEVARRWQLSQSGQ